MTDANLARRNAIVEANLPLVLYHLRGRLWHRRGWVDGDDLKQEGALGLIRAVERHDANLGTLSTYAWAWIRVAASDALGDACHPFHVPKYARRSEPVVDASEAGLDDLPARGAAPCKETNRKARHALWAAVERLGEPGRTVIRLRYGEGLLLGEISERLGCTCQAIQQAEARAIRRLRKILGEDRG